MKRKQKKQERKRIRRNRICRTKPKSSRKRLYDEQKQQTKTRLQFEKEVKPQSDLYHRSPLAPMKTAVSLSGQKALGELHGKIAEAEHENTAVEAAHKTEQKAETLAHYSVRTAKYINGQRKNAPYQKAARLQHKAEKAEIKAIHEKTLAENPQLKKIYAEKVSTKATHKETVSKGETGGAIRKGGKENGAEHRTGRKAVYRLCLGGIKQYSGVILAVALFDCMAGYGSFFLLRHADNRDKFAYGFLLLRRGRGHIRGGGILCILGTGFAARINRIESDYPRYDEYQYNMAQVGHNPYELISYLTAVYMDFQFDDIQGGLDELFNSQYHLRITETTEQRTDEDGTPMNTKY